MTYTNDQESSPIRDSGEDFPDAARRVLVKLLSRRFVTRGQLRDGDGWNVLLAYREQIVARLADLFFTLEVDSERGVALKRRADGGDLPKVLIRQESRLSRDASFLLLFLRQEWAFNDPDEETLVVTRSQLAEFLGAYREDDDRDGAKFTRRVDAAITALDVLGLLAAARDADHLYVGSPAIVSLLGIDEITRIELAYRRGLAQEVAAPLDAVDVEEGVIS